MNYSKNAAGFFSGCDDYSRMTMCPFQPRITKPAKKNITLTCVEFIRRFMMRVLPAGFQKSGITGS